MNTGKIIFLQIMDEILSPRKKSLRDACEKPKK